MKNRYVISDIHGCSKTFQSLLRTINYSRKDELYLLGDYIDRGPNSKEVLDIILGLEQQKYKVICLKGNHEDMLINEIENEVWPPGIPETLKSFEVNHNNEIPKKYVEWLKKLSHFYEVENYLLVHAGLSFRSSNPLLDKYDMLWVRDWYKKINWEWLSDRIIIHGHTPIESNKIIGMRDQLNEGKVLNIDNGCVYREDGLKNLCCFNMRTKELIFEPNQDKFYRE